jgi:hypothetical protein
MVRETHVEALINDFASSLPHRELVDARIVGRISFWKSFAMRRVGEMAQQRRVGSEGSPGTSVRISNLPSRKSISIEAESAVSERDPDTDASVSRLKEGHDEVPEQVHPQTVVHLGSGTPKSAESSSPDRSQNGTNAARDGAAAGLTEHIHSANAAEIMIDSCGPAMLARAKLRSDWLDEQLAQHKEWTSDTFSAANGGPSYNTIRRYRSGAVSTREPSVRRQLAVAFKCDISDV